MNSQNLNTLIGQEQVICKHSIKDFEIFKWDVIKKQLIKTKIEITFTQENQIVYSQGGVVLRMYEQANDTIENQRILTNMEQIQKVQWQGEYGDNKRKSGYWRVAWEGYILKKIGGYGKILENQYTFRMDQNKAYGMNQIIIFGCKLAQVYESGEYCKDQRSGEWIYSFDNKKIGGGSYNQSGQKNGKWINLGDGFYNHSQVTYAGEYKDGKKIGIWDIWFKKQFVNKRNEIIGGGSYDQGGLNKIGKWIELCDGFQEFCQVTCTGNYKNGKKVGKWSIWYRSWETNNNIQIGGGSYDDEGSSKIGKWIEISDEFRCDLQITLNGEYSNGKRIGLWQKINIKNNTIYSHINYEN